MKRLLNWNHVKYSFYVLTHPSDGYYEIRHREKGSVLLALIYVVLFSISFSMNRIKASFIVNEIDPRSVDSFDELKGVILLFLLITIGNWSITCLMGGEGRYKDIVIAIGYAVLPMVLTLLPATLFSQFIANDEEAFYFIIIGFGVIWSCVLALVGIMTVHNYSMAKTLLTLVLTFVAVLIILFIIMMLSSLMAGLTSFVKSVYLELTYRV